MSTYVVMLKNVPRNVIIAQYIWTLPAYPNKVPRLGDGAWCPNRRDGRPLAPNRGVIHGVRGREERSPPSEQVILRKKKAERVKKSNRPPYSEV